jgi:hypothetical protein
MYCHASLCLALGGLAGKIGLQEFRKRDGIQGQSQDRVGRSRSVGREDLREHAPPIPRIGTRPSVAECPANRAYDSRKSITTGFSRNQFVLKLR